MIAPKQQLVEKVARAISQWMNGQMLPCPPNWDRLQESTRGAYRNQAQAALDACHAEELRDLLKSLMGEFGFVVPAKEWEERDLFETARALLAKLEGQPSEEN
jgi:hypothetical protein